MIAPSRLCRCAGLLRVADRLSFTRGQARVATIRLLVPQPSRSYLVLQDTHPQMVCNSTTRGIASKTPKEVQRLVNTAISDAGIHSVHVISVSGEQLGVLSTEDALKQAQSAGLQLALVSPSANPPVCRMMDPKAQKVKKEKETTNAKKQRTSAPVVKDMRLSETIGEHDLNIKMKKIRQFLDKQYQVRIFMNNFKDANKAKEVLEEMWPLVEDIGVIIEKPRIKGRKITLHVGPKLE